MLKIIVIGAGTNGVMTALELAEKGYHVTLLEKNSEILSSSSEYPDCQLGFSLDSVDKIIATQNLSATLNFIEKFSDFCLKIDDEKLHGHDYLHMEDSESVYYNMASIIVELDKFYKQQNARKKLLGKSRERINISGFNDKRFAQTDDRKLLWLGELNHEQLETNTLYLYSKEDNEKITLYYKCKRENEEIVDVELCDKEIANDCFLALTNAVKTNNLQGIKKEHIKQLLKFAASKNHILPSRLYQAHYITHKYSLSWPKLKNHLIDQIINNKNITLLTNTDVIELDINKDIIMEESHNILNYKLKCKKVGNDEIFILDTKNLVNATSHDIDRSIKTINLIETISLPNPEIHCKYLHARVIIELPEKFKDIRSTTCCHKPFCMITTFGNGHAVITYYPTSLVTQTANEMIPKDMQQFIDGKADINEVEKISKSILNGINRFLPGIDQAKIINTIFDIVRPSSCPTVVNTHNSSEDQSNQLSTSINKNDYIINPNNKLISSVNYANEVVKIIEKNNSIEEAHEIIENNIQLDKKLLMTEKPKNETSVLRQDKLFFNTINRKRIKKQTPLLTKTLVKNFEQKAVNSLLFLKPVKKAVVKTTKNNNKVDKYFNPTNN